MGKQRATRRRTTPRRIEMTTTNSLGVLEDVEDEFLHPYSVHFSRFNHHLAVRIPQVRNLLLGDAKGKFFAANTKALQHFTTIFKQYEADERYKVVGHAG